jgi:hypothetical protein
MKVIVVGCGPAGLAAAHAAVGQYCEVVVYAPKSKRDQIGPLLLQRPIPGINQDHPDFTLRQIVIDGSILDYRYKLYGDVNIGINGDILREHLPGWDHRKTYDKLWDMYEHIIEHRWVTPDELSRLHEQADLVVSTANAQSMCQVSSHNFIAQPIIIARRASLPNQPDNLTVFNGGDRYDWVRSAIIGGNASTEWPVTVGFKPGSKLISKPIATDCTCFPHILRTGRYGAWKNETWVDTAYWDTFSTIGSMKRAPEMADFRILEAE